MRLKRAADGGGPRMRLFAATLTDPIRVVRLVQYPPAGCHLGRVTMVAKFMYPKVLASHHATGVAGLHIPTSFKPKPGFSELFSA